MKNNLRDKKIIEFDGMHDLHYKFGWFIKIHMMFF